MNAKKSISLLTLASSAALLLAACGGNNVSSTSSSANNNSSKPSDSSLSATNPERTNAENVLDAMTAAVTASGYSYPTEYDISYQVATTMTGAIHFSQADHFIYAKYVGTTVNYENSTITADTESWVFQSGNDYIVANHSSTGNTYAVIDAAAFATLSTAFANKSVSTISESPASFSHFLKNFDNGTQSTVTVNNSSETVILAGGSSSGLWMKSETYTSTGAGNLTANLVIGRSYGDEPLVYSWDSSRVVSEVNNSTSTTETFTWDSYTANTVDYSKFTLVTDSVAIAAMVTAVTAIATSF